MTEFKEIYDNLSSLDISIYAGLAVISTAVLGVGLVFYLGNKYCSKNSKKDETSNLEKKVEE
jgi:hypothetical protein